jgi:GDP-L-fucose synthase
LIGSAIVTRLRQNGFTNLLLASHKELELTHPNDVDQYFERHSPKYVVLAAGQVGGIVQNQTNPADFINTNLSIQLNLLRAAHKTDVSKLILFASSCMYPRDCPQPMSESALLSGHPEPSSMAYAISKLAGLQMCLAYNQQYGHKKFIPVIPNSAYGPRDNFDPKSGHVLSSLIRRFHEAKKEKLPSITLWGSGNPRREFVHSSDIASACISLLQADTATLELPLNIGTGQDYSIKELAYSIASVIGYNGQINWDTSKPDGAPRKLLDSSRMRALGWQPSIEFTQGLETTYQWYLENIENTESTFE